MKARMAWYAVWADGTKWLMTSPQDIAACFKRLGEPKAPIVRMERVVIYR
jgi:hypothetical protein